MSAEASAPPYRQSRVGSGVASPRPLARPGHRGAWPRRWRCCRCSPRTSTRSTRGCTSPTSWLRSPPWWRRVDWPGGGPGRWRRTPCSWSAPWSCSGTFHYIGLLSVLMLLSLYSLATHASRRAGAARAGSRDRVLRRAALAGCPTCGPRTCCWRSRCSWRRGRSGRRSGRGVSSSATRLRARRHRGAPADRPRAARRGRPQHVAHRRPGGGGRARHPHRPGRRGTVARRSSPTRAGGRSSRPGRCWACCARSQRTARGRPPRASTTSPRLSRTSGPPDSTVELVRSGGCAGARSRGLAGCLPDRAGVAHQRHQALRRHDRHGQRRSRRRRARHRGLRSRAERAGRGRVARGTVWSGSTSVLGWSAAR